MRDLVSERRRGRYFGTARRLTTISTFVALVIAGVILHELDTAGATYLGFVLIFLVAFVARLVLGVSPDVPPTSPPCTIRRPTCTSSTGGAACFRRVRSASRSTWR